MFFPSQPVAGGSGILKGPIMNELITVAKENAEKAITHIEAAGLIKANDRTVPEGEPTPANLWRIVYDSQTAIITLCNAILPKDGQE